MKQAAFTAFVAIAAGIALSAEVRFTSTFKSMDAGSTSFAGQKVAALIMTKDDSLRVAGEEALASELTARGMQGVATYRIAPKEELQKAETAKGWFEKAAVAGVVALRPIAAEMRTTYSPGVWVSPSYGTLWGYYGYGWSAVFVPGSRQQQTTVVVETLVFSLPRNQILWGAVTETANARDLKGFVQELAKESVKEMQKQGLARRLK